jgi:hypothetical protein
VRSLLNSPAQLGLVRSYYPGSLIGMFAWGRAGGQSSARPVSLAPAARVVAAPGKPPPS